MEGTEVEWVGWWLEKGWMEGVVGEGRDYGDGRELESMQSWESDSGWVKTSQYSR